MVEIDTGVTPLLRAKRSMLTTTSLPNFGLPARSTATALPYLGLTRPTSEIQLAPQRRWFDDFPSGNGRTDAMPLTYLPE